MSKKVVVASGYFDPIHYGHIEYLKKSKDLGDTLIVIVNNDKQATLKKGKPFMPAAERVKLVRSLECVDAAVESMDTDRTVCKTLAALHPDIFANGGDQFNTSIPEAKVCFEMGIDMRDGLGGKIQSSSWLIKAAKEQAEHQKKQASPQSAPEAASEAEVEHVNDNNDPTTTPTSSPPPTKEEKVEAQAVDDDKDDNDDGNNDDVTTSNKPNEDKKMKKKKKKVRKKKKKIVSAKGKSKDETSNQ